MAVIGPLKLCPAKYVGQDGFEFSCDLLEDHVGLHEAEDYDRDRDCFRTCEWGKAVTDWEKVRAALEVIFWSDLFRGFMLWPPAGQTCVEK